MAKTEKEEAEFALLWFPVVRKFNVRCQLIISHLYTLFSCIVGIVKPCGYVGLSGRSLSLVPKK